MAVIEEPGTAAEQLVLLTITGTFTQSPTILNAIPIAATAIADGTASTTVLISHSRIKSQEPLTLEEERSGLGPFRLILKKVNSRPPREVDQVDDILIFELADETHSAISDYSHELVFEWDDGSQSTVSLKVEVHHPCELITNHLFLGLMQGGQQHIEFVRILASTGDLLENTKVTASKSNIKASLDIVRNSLRLEALAPKRNGRFESNVEITFPEGMQLPRVGLA